MNMWRSPRLIISSKGSELTVGFGTKKTFSGGGTPFLTPTHMSLTKRLTVTKTARMPRARLSGFFSVKKGARSRGKRLTVGHRDKTEAATKKTDPNHQTVLSWEDERAKKEWKRKKKHQVENAGT